MNFRRAAQAALAGRNNAGWVILAVSLVLAALSTSCGSKGSGSSGASHNGYISLPATGQVALLHIKNSTGAISFGPQTQPVVGSSPNAVVLHPSGKFLYAVNEAGDSISIFNVAADGTLTLSATPTPAGSGPRAAAIDASGNFLVVSNGLSNPGTVSVFAIGSGGGTLSQVPNSPFPAGPNPTDLKIAGELVYVANPNSGNGEVEAFSLNTSNGFLTPSPHSPFTAVGLNAIAIDPAGPFLYTANFSANTVSAFQIVDQVTGDLQELPGSPFCSTPGCTGAGSGPGALAVDPSGKFLYVSTPGSSSSIWGFTIAPATGQLAPVANSPFSLSAGIVFLIMEPNGKFFYIGNQTPSGSNIAGYSYDASTGALIAITGSPFSTGTPLGGMLITH